MSNSMRVAGTCVLTLLALLAAPRAHALVIDSEVYLGHTYYLLDLSSWVGAEAESVGLGGHLVTINDDAENSFVASRFGVATGIFGRRQDLWLGLTDKDVEGVFEWSSGAPLVYTNWVTGEPNDCAPVMGGCRSEDYVHMPWWGTPLGTWNDIPDDLGLLYGVAEVESPVPEPSSLVLISLGLAAGVRRMKRRRP